MRRMLETTLFLLAVSSAALAVPALQLYIDGAVYDWETETWVIHDQPQFHLYVVGAIPQGEEELEHIWMVVSTASETEPEQNIIIDGELWPEHEWVFGSPPFPPEIPHGVFPAWHFSVDIGEFHALGGVGDVVPDSSGQFFDPSQGYIDDCNHLGEIKVFSVEVPEGLTNVHFDAYQLDDCEMERFAPFSHDAGFAGTILGISDDSVVPRKSALLTAYPNPFNAETIIEFNLPATTDISLKLYDITGRMVIDLTKGRYNAGVHTVNWDGRNKQGQNVSSGVYLVRLSTETETITRRVVLLK